MSTLKSIFQPKVFLLNKLITSYCNPLYPYHSQNH